MKLVFKKLKIFSNHCVHFGRVIGPIETEHKQMEAKYIKNLGNLKPETQDECYLANMPIKIMKVMAGASENYKFHCKPSTLTKPPEELQSLIFPFIERCKISLNDVDASDTSTIYCALLGFMERVRTVLLQYFSQLINIGRTHILFDPKVFKTGLLLNHRETSLV